MTTKNRMQVYLPSELKEKLAGMAEELGLTQNQLAVMALHSLAANYKAKGSFIFVDLLNPETKK